MAEIVTRGELLSPDTVSELFNSVQGKSTLAKLCGTVPVSFSGSDVFTFAMDSEAAIVGESEEKENGGVTVSKVTMRPVKLEYGARFTDEFIYGSEEKSLEITNAFIDGAAKKFARALDIMGFHGVNPRTGEISTQLGTNYIDAAASIVTYADDPEAALEDATAAVGDYDISGLAFSKTFSAALAKLTSSAGVKLYPEFALGASPDTYNGIGCDVNSTVSFGDSDLAVVGDFANAFKWGYAADIMYDVIKYGDPDNTGRDLKGHNEVYLRMEAYLGFAVLDPNAFAVIKAASE